MYNIYFPKLFYEETPSGYGSLYVSSLSGMPCFFNFFSMLSVRFILLSKATPASDAAKPRLRHVQLQQKTVDVGVVAPVHTEHENFVDSVADVALPVPNGKSVFRLHHLTSVIRQCKRRTGPILMRDVEDSVN